MVEWHDHRESERLVRSLTNRVMRRLSTINTPFMSREDIEQELWIAWCKARDGYDPDRGVPFGAYVYRGMLTHINRFIERHVERFEQQTFARSLSAQVEEDGGELQEVIPGDMELAMDKVERDSCYAAAMRNMTPQAQTFVRILKEQPQEVLREVMMADDKEEQAKRVGAPFIKPRRITSKMVFDIMGLTTRERHRIMREVKNMGAKVSE